MDIVVRRVVGDIDMEAAKSIRIEVFVQEQHVTSGDHLLINFFKNSSD